MRDDALARAMYIAAWIGEPEEERAERWDGCDARAADMREHWRREAARVRRILGITPPPERRHPLPDDVVQCPLCGCQWGPGGTKCDVGDDDSVSVDDVVGILASEEEGR